jgi:hypothetical protein
MTEHRFVTLIPTVMRNDRWFRSQIFANPLKKRKFEKGTMSRCPQPMVEGGKTEVAPAGAGAGVMPRQRNRAAERLVGLREVAPALQMDDGTVLVHMEAEIKIARRLPTSLAQSRHLTCPLGPSPPDLSLYAI